MFFLIYALFIKYKYIHGNFHPYTFANALNAETSAMNQPIIIQTGGDKSLSFAPLLARPHALSLVSHPLHGRLTSDPDPSPSLWVLIICLSVKHQRPSSPPLSAAVSLASGTLRDSSSGSHHWKGAGRGEGGICKRRNVLRPKETTKDKKRAATQGVAAGCHTSITPSLHLDLWPVHIPLSLGNQLEFRQTNRLRVKFLFSKQRSPYQGWSSVMIASNAMIKVSQTDTESSVACFIWRPFL